MIHPLQTWSGFLFALKVEGKAEGGMS
jgi:hypothetical protein